MLALLIIREGIALEFRPESSVRQGGICVEARGDVKAAGIYCFAQRPTIGELLSRAKAPGRLTGPEMNSVIDNGTGVEVSMRGEGINISRFEMSAFYRISLGIPLSLSEESREGLMAVPGIGPRLADNIIEERNRRGGLMTVKDLEHVKGVGPNFLRDIRPYFGE